MSKKWIKITECSCIQYFDGETCISQELKAANESDYEDMDGKPIDCPNDRAYMPFVMDQPETVLCKFCHKQVGKLTAHEHDSGWVGHECCWDERLRSSE